MTAKELYDILLKIESRLSRMEGKTNIICENTHEMATRIGCVEDRLSKLPCESHAKEFTAAVERRVSWKQLFGVVVLIAGVVFGSFVYTSQVNDGLKSHEINYSVHFHPQSLNEENP